MTEFSHLEQLNEIGEGLQPLHERRWLVRSYSVTPTGGQVSIPVHALERWGAKDRSSSTHIVEFPDVAAVVPISNRPLRPRIADQMRRSAPWRRNISQSGQLTLPTPILKRWGIEEGERSVDIADLYGDEVAILRKGALQARIKDRLPNVPAELAQTVVTEVLGSDRSVLRQHAARQIIMEVLPEIYGP